MNTTKTPATVRELGDMAEHLGITAADLLAAIKAVTAAEATEV